MRFWDSSALVPLLVHQPVSSEVDRWFAADRAIALWALASTEIASALWRLVRESRLDEAHALAADRRAGELAAASYEVVDLEGVRSRARRLLRTHPLRAADALHLAAALVWCRDRPEGRVLHTLDLRLAAAARREGFTVP